MVTRSRSANSGFQFRFHELDPFILVGAVVLPQDRDFTRTTNGSRSFRSELGRYLLSQPLIHVRIADHLLQWQNPN